MSYRLLTMDIRVARKSHRCTWCGQSIDPGQQYKSQRGIYDGALQVDKFHPECNKAAADECFSEGGDWEYMPYENERPDSEAQKP